MSDPAMVFGSKIPKEQYDALVNALGDDKIRGTDDLKQKILNGTATEADFVSNLDRDRDGKFGSPDIDFDRSSSTAFTALLKAYEELTKPASGSSGTGGISRFAAKPLGRFSVGVDEATAWFNTEYGNKPGKLLHDVGSGAFDKKVKEWGESVSDIGLTDYEREAFDRFVQLHVVAVLNAKGAQFLKEMFERDFIRLFHFVGYSPDSARLPRALAIDLDRRTAALRERSDALFSEATVQVMGAAYFPDETSRCPKPWFASVKMLITPKNGQPVRIVLFDREPLELTLCSVGGKIPTQVLRISAQDYLIPDEALRNILQYPQKTPIFTERQHLTGELYYRDFEKPGEPFVLPKTDSTLAARDWFFRKSLWCVDN